MWVGCAGHRRGARPKVLELALCTSDVLFFSRMVSAELHTRSRRLPGEPHPDGKGLRGLRHAKLNAHPTVREHLDERVQAE